MKPEYIERYIATAAARESSAKTAQSFSDALGVSLDEVLAVVQGLGKWESAAVLSRSGSAKVDGPAANVRVSAPLGHVSVTVTADGKTDSLTRIHYDDVNHVTDEIRHNNVAKLSVNQWILVAVVLIAAIFPLLPTEVQAKIQAEAGLAAALAAVLALIKKS